MEEFKIRKLPNGCMLVIGLSYVSVLTMLKEISNELPGGYSKTVYFDTVLSNGNASNRFCSIEYADGEFIRETFKIENEDIWMLSGKFSSYFNMKPHLLDNGILCDYEKKIVLANIYK